MSSTIGVVVEALGSSVLVAISMLVRSAYSNSESVEVWSVFRYEEEEDEVESEGLKSYIGSDSDAEEKESWV